MATVQLNTVPADRALVGYNAALNPPVFNGDGSIIMHKPKIVTVEGLVSGEVIDINVKTHPDETWKTFTSFDGTTAATGLAEFSVPYNFVRADFSAGGTNAAEASTFDLAAGAGGFNGLYFDFYTPETPGGFRVWAKVTDHPSGAAVAPAAEGHTLIEYDITVSTTIPDHATAIRSAINTAASAEVTAAGASATVTLTNVTAGPVRDFDLSNYGATSSASVTTQGGRAAKVHAQLEDE